MDLIWLVLVVCVIGCLVWLLTTQIPMPPGLAKVVQVATVIILALYVLTRVIALPNVLTR